MEVLENVLNVEETDSTNNHLNRLLAKEDFPDGFAVLAKNQTAGRGQIGHCWSSEYDKNLLFSLLLHPTFIHVADQFYLMRAVEVAIVETLRNGFGSENFVIKWPNDIYYNDRKLCGFIVDNLLTGAEITHAIVGIGLNVNQTKFDESLPNPISLANIVGEEIDKESLFKDLRTAILKEYQLLKDDDMNFEFLNNRYLYMIYKFGEWTKYSDSNGEFEGRIIDIEPTGRVVIQPKRGDFRKYYIGEVEYIHETIENKK